MDPFSLLLASLLLGITLFAGSLLLSLALLEGVETKARFWQSRFATPRPQRGEER